MPGTPPPRPTVVGAGIAGIACARELAVAGLAPRVLDRGRRIGGRMAVRTVDGRPIDLGASYLTVRDPAFGAVVEDWLARGLARPWTDTFHVATPEGIEGTRTGPVRYAAPRGLRSLVEDLARGLGVEHPYDVSDVSPTRAGTPSVAGRAARVAVLAMPGPQALDLLSERYAAAREAADAVWEPTLALVARWPRRCWPQLDGVFVNDSPVLTFVADDGSRRGDGAPVLVAHSHPVLAAGHLDDPERAAPAMLAELRAVLHIAKPAERVDVMRWSLAKPVEPRPEPFHLDEAIGLCGDGWHGPSRVEAAYLSGRALGLELARRLG
ncbi:MAG TPA: FAD-dependent oxidoreductase [Actinomycetes bacterium]|nr:FAD-dependent oxidoreductase [Actinomycetes bacterium]